MNPALIIRHLTIKAIPVYSCVKCAAKASGSTVRGTVDGQMILADEVFAAITEAITPVSNNHMPVGWKSSMDGHHCPSCP